MRIYGRRLGILVMIFLDIVTFDKIAKMTKNKIKKRISNLLLEILEN